MPVVIIACEKDPSFDEKDNGTSKPKP